MIKPMLLHIDIGNQSLVNWANSNKYIIHSELIRYCEKLILGEFEVIEAIMISNLADNVVFMVSEKNVADTLDKAMEYFLEIEEYEQCGKIRDLLILISNRNKSIKKNGRELKKTNLQS
jgi:hypothetical protein